VKDWDGQCPWQAETLSRERQKKTALTPKAETFSFGAHVTPIMNTFARAMFASVLPLAMTGSLTAQQDEGFVSLFDGKTLNGWTEMHKEYGPPYFVTNGVIASPADAGNDLVTDREFADYILRLDFKLTPGANNGVGMRVPFQTNDLTYAGNEVQVLDDDDAHHAHLDPGQYCGSLYKIFAAKRGALRKVGQWNHYEISAIGRHIKVVLNGQTIEDGNVNDVTNREVLREHPGMLRESGPIALLGHWRSNCRITAGRSGSKTFTSAKSRTVRRGNRRWTPCPP
jgi:hypothetical protein